MFLNVTYIGGSGAEAAAASPIGGAKKRGEESGKGEKKKKGRREGKKGKKKIKRRGEDVENGPTFTSLYENFTRAFALALPV